VGYVRRFADLGLPMARLLQEARSRHVLAEYVDTLLAAFSDDRSVLSPIQAPLPEPLTEREQEVLELLAAGLTNREIAEHLVISPETVKKHTGSIYAKLGVHIYGQGMTVAALEAAALGGCLAGDRSQLAKQFFAKASKIIDVPWSTAIGNDLCFPEVAGPRMPLVRFLNWYIGKLHIAAHTDAQVSITFLKVINMIAPPASILHPRILWRVMKGNLRPGQPKASAAEERALHRQGSVSANPE
jgi:DNA-binding CsgD family transcriptional regulator